MKHILVPGGTHFVTTVTKNRENVFWNQVGGHWQPVIEACDSVIRNLEFYRRKFKFLLHGFVIMPDHLHLLLTVDERGALPEIIRDVKHRIATEIQLLRKSQGALWQADYYEHGIRNDSDFREKLGYIHDNPVRAGLLHDALATPYSSARAWEKGEHEPLQIDLID